MASMSLAPPAEIENVSNYAPPPRHARKHSRHPTAAAPLPAFSFNPGEVSSSQKPADNEQDSDITIAPVSGHMRRPSKPAPLPDFSFNPGADMPVEQAPSPTHPILEEMALNQQRVSKSAKPAPLPAFTFNPSSAFGSTSPSKVDPEEEPQKVAGHRRGNSEFVGGKVESAHMVTTSPAKHEPRPSGPPISASGFRGHTHRRSQAISVGDIDTSDLIKQHALAKARNPSNPSTPQETSFAFPRPSPGKKFDPPTSRSPPSSPRRERSSMSGYRPRTVDFSDRVDVIPRPLSMISSETERSSSTIRGHSLSNSINSIASPTPVSLPEELAVTSPFTAEPVSERRPNTADASLLLSSSKYDDNKDLLSLPKRPLSACGSPMVSSSGSPPLKKKHFWATQGTDATPTPTPKEEKANPFDTEMKVAEPSDEIRARPKTAPERPSVRKGRKYHTWTAGIFSKKTKSRGTKKPKRNPTPPALLKQDSDKLNDIFDEDNTVVLREDSPISAQRQAPIRQPLSIQLPQSSVNDFISPVIDLDAALDPFTDDRRHSDDNARSTTAKIAKLHSSERRAVVDAFGVSHRRTESAPALSPVNRSALFGMRHHGSNASLSEEVFDEQEEDNFLAHEEEIKSHSALQSSESVNKQPSPVVEGGLGLSSVLRRADDVVIVDLDLDAESEDIRSSKSTIEAPAMLVNEMPKRPATSPMTFAYSSPQLHYASSTEGRTTSVSLISSPDPDHVSFESGSRPRRFGELNPDSVRPSTDDVPSLSDGASSNVRASCSGNVRPSLEQRSHSMFTPGTSRVQEGWKRSSLASFHRLIPGSSHGSRQRLEGLPSDAEEKTKKKPNRISRLMHFWRSKEAGDKQRA